MPIKLDIDSDEYRQWRQDYASEGNTIPKLFVVRADGETLYGQSGSLVGDMLPEMLIQALRHSGRILTAKESQTLVAASDLFEKRKQEGDLPGAIKSLGKLKKLGLPGEIASYAEPAMRMNQLVIETMDEATDKLEELETSILSEDATTKLDALLGFLEVKRNYGGLKRLKPEIAKFQKKFVSTRETRDLAREARMIDGARAAKTKSARTRSIARLKDLMGESEFESVRSAAKKTLAILELELESD